MKPDQRSRTLSHFLQGGYAPEQAKFDEAAFTERWHLPFFLVFSFLRRFFRRDYVATGNDPILSMVVSEIWLFNIGRLLAQNADVDAEALADEEFRRLRLPKCNTYSLSQYLGVPAQTVRRKVQILIDRGWVERAENGELHITSSAEAEFTPEFNLETMRDFVSTARTLLDLLETDFNSDAGARKRPA